MPVIGAAVLLGHNLLDMVWPQTSLLDASTGGPLWAALHSQVTYLAGPILIRVTYPLLPWIGVMLLGFGTASVFEAPPARRRMRLLASGVAATVAFVVIRASGLYGDPNPWQAGRQPDSPRPSTSSTRQSTRPACSSC